MTYQETTPTPGVFTGKTKRVSLIDEDGTIILSGRLEVFGKTRDGRDVWTLRTPTEGHKRMRLAAEMKRNGWAKARTDGKGRTGKWGYTPC